LIEKVIRSEKKRAGDLSFIITTDKVILGINREFLGHDYFTDVIAFGCIKGNLAEGEVYISVDTVRRNADNYKVSFKEEMLRVMIHGTLHICGYNDTTEDERRNMTIMENTWIERGRQELWNSDTIL
jgi:rRNA maturation RNase YbeY